jgi:ABC-type nitrate/sulfonate/bicarbonate transport system ATPase subunit
LPTAAVDLIDVAISFVLADGGRYDAVSPCSLTVDDGQFVAIVGPTGCGKSTLLNAAAGLLSPSAGTVSIFGQPLVGLNAQAGYLFQADALMPWKTARDNVAMMRWRERTHCWHASGCAASLTAIRTSSPAVNASGWPSRRCSCVIRRSC